MESEQKKHRGGGREGEHMENSGLLTSLSHSLDTAPDQA